MKTVVHDKKATSTVTTRFTIGEGNTPLIPSRFIGPSLGLKNLYFKLENLNPTGSYKDRFAAAFIGTLLQKKAAFCLATSSGNTGAALAAYCAAARISCYVVIVDNAPADKIRQMHAYGARTLMVEGFGIDTEITKAVFSGLEKLAKTKDLSLPISAYRYCPEGMQGVETITQEIQTTLNGAVDHLFSPSGGGGLTLAVANGVLSSATPVSCRVHCVQPRGNNTIAGALRNGLAYAAETPKSTTAISGLQVPGILDGNKTLQRCRQTGGTGFVVTDEAVYDMQKTLAQKEGIFCEAAGAVSVSGLAEAVRNGEVAADDTIVCLITGSGFKDMNSPARNAVTEPVETKYTVDNLFHFLATLQANDPI